MKNMLKTLATGFIAGVGMMAAQWLWSGTLENKANELKSRVSKKD